MKPELTITRPCPTCGGTGRRNDEPDKGHVSKLGIVWSKPFCPDCDQGVVRVAVSCAGCALWNEEFEECGIDGRDEGVDWQGNKLWDATVDGCSKWEPKP